MIEDEEDLPNKFSYFLSKLSDTDIIKNKVRLSHILIETCKLLNQSFLTFSQFYESRPSLLLSKLGPSHPDWPVLILDQLCILLQHLQLLSSLLLPSLPLKC